jgi:uncharacterized membrane protein (UPF0136 family)
MPASAAFAATVAIPLRRAPGRAAPSRVPQRAARRVPPARAARMSAIGPAAARALVGAYGVIVAGGGVGAFLKTRSTMSAVSGVGAGAVLAAAFATDNVGLALGTACALAIVFGVRLAKTKKLMPAGALLGLSLAFAVAFGVALLT